MKWRNTMRQGKSQPRWRTPLVVASTLLVVAAAGLSGVALASAAEVPSTLAASAGCGKSPTLTSGPRTIQSGGTTRNFILRIPANYDNNRPYRLFFGFHWNGGT